jgi:CSLREA domain-containing protein
LPAFRRRAAGVVLLAVVLTFGGGAARAATFTVNNASDSTDGTCGPAPDGCTLREAIEAAVATPGRDAIGFDPATFPPAGAAPSIVVLTPLPVIADPAGTVIDGKGATVFIDAGGQPRALVFASAAGVPLSKVTVANLAVVNVTGIAIEVCGGVSPDCDEDVTAVLVQQVVASGMDGGIAVLGDVVSKIRVVGAAVSILQATGIAILADRTLLGARVEGCTVLGGTGGIRLAAGERVVKAAVVDSVAARSLRGIRIQGPDVRGTKIADIVTTQNGDGGTRVLADGANVGTTITNVTASAFGANGVEVVGGPGSRALTIRNVTADRGKPDGNGIGAQGPFDGAVFTNLALTGNGLGLNIRSEGASFLADGNPNCDGNVWKDNFAVTNAACLD